MHNRSPFSSSFFPLILIFFTALNVLVTFSDFAFAINTPPVLIPLSQKKVIENQLLLFTVTAADPDANDILTLRASRLPRGATFVDNGNRTGTFSWRPDYDQAGVYKNTFFTVSDGMASDTEFAYIIVTNVNRPPVLNLIGPKQVNEEARLTFQVSATDPDSRDTVILSVTNPPAGASFVDNGNGTGVFDWTPARGVAATYNVTFVAANPRAKLSTAGADSENVPIVVRDITPPVITDIHISDWGPSYVLIAWTTDEPSTSQVDYGTTSGYGQTTLLDMNRVRSHFVLLPELGWSTNYHYRVRSHNVTFLVSESTDQQFSTVARSRSVVTINGRQLIVQKRNLNGTLGTAAPYIMRGVGWSPASIATVGDNTIRRGEFQNWYQTDIPLMKSMNVNTVRTFIDLGYDAQLGPIGMTILDELYKRGIMVVMTVDDGSNILTRIDGAVDYYKNHPAVLLWSLGSEWSINNYFGHATSLLHAAQLTQTAALRVKSRDAFHPVVTSYGNAMGNVYSDGRTPDFEMLEYFVNTTCPAVDIWSFNEYRGRGFSYFFDRWKFVSGKPMFFGEFGIDAYDSRVPAGVNQATQAQWDLDLWNEIARNLSANDPNNTALGGFIFEWNDEWWKISPAGSQQTTGWFPAGFPDGAASEEYWGIVDINRNPRQVYSTLTEAFSNSFVPSPASNTRTFASFSAGFNSGLARAEFRENGTTFYSDGGFSYNGARGINVAAIDPVSGHLLTQVRNFDTWLYGSTGEAHYALINYLDSLPTGAIVLFSTADTAGICGTCTNDWHIRLIAKLREFGSTLASQYPFRGSWAMLSVKGESAARSEVMSANQTVTAEATFNFS